VKKLKQEQKYQEVNNKIEKKLKADIKEKQEYLHM